MKKMFLIVLVIMLSIANVCFAETVTLQWDANEPAPDGYKLFHRIEGTVYNYDSPMANNLYTDGLIPANTTMFITEDLQEPELVSPAPVTMTSGENAWDKENSIVTLSWTQPNTVINLNHYFVVRAFVGLDTSGDSNEVLHTISRDLVVEHWKLFYSESPDGPWVYLDQVNNTGQSTASINTPISIVELGDRKTIYFTVISFVNEDLYSSNSQVVSVDVDRRVLNPPNNLRIVVTIPVQ